MIWWHNGTKHLLRCTKHWPRLTKNCAQGSLQPCSTHNTLYITHYQLYRWWARFSHTLNWEKKSVRDLIPRSHTRYSSIDMATIDTLKIIIMANITVLNTKLLVRLKPKPILIRRRKNPEIHSIICLLVGCTFGP